MFLTVKQSAYSHLPAKFKIIHLLPSTNKLATRSHLQGNNPCFGLIFEVSTRSATDISFLLAIKHVECKAISKLAVG